MQASMRALATSNALQRSATTSTTTSSSTTSSSTHRACSPALLQQPRRHSLLQLCRAGEAGSISPVEDLIKRDRRDVELTDAFDAAPEAAAAPAAAAPDQQQQQETTAAVGKPDRRSGSKSSSRSKAASARAASSSSSSGPKTRKQRQQAMAAAEADAAADSSSSSSQQQQYKRCKEAIDAGLAAFAAKNYDEAIELFNLSLELPGNSAFRTAGSPREFACPSEAEEQAAMYNLACCYAQLGQAAAALTCIDSALESGFADVATLRSDPDLRPIQGPELNALINKYTGVGGMLTRLLGQQRKEDAVLESDPNKNKPWLMW